jgi:hypothetical protein
MKETDCFYALLNEVSTRSQLPSATQMHANMLLKDPAERMRAIESSFVDVEAMIPDALQHIQGATDTNLHQESMNELSEAIQNVALKQEASDTSSIEEGFEAIDPFSFLSYLRTTSFIPDCVSVLSSFARVPTHSGLVSISISLVRFQILTFGRQHYLEFLGGALSTVRLVAA